MFLPGCAPNICMMNTLLWKQLREHLLCWLFSEGFCSPSAQWHRLWTASSTVTGSVTFVVRGTVAAVFVDKEENLCFYVCLCNNSWNHQPTFSISDCVLLFTFILYSWGSEHVGLSQELIHWMFFSVKQFISEFKRKRSTFWTLRLFIWNFLPYLYTYEASTRLVLFCIGNSQGFSIGNNIHHQGCWFLSHRGAGTWILLPFVTPALG